MIIHGRCSYRRGWGGCRCGTFAFQRFGPDIAVAIISRFTKNALKKTGLQLKSITLPNGQRADYLEKPAAEGSDGVLEPTIVFLCGFTMSAEMMSLESVPALKKGCDRRRVVVVEFPGQGSMIDQVLRPDGALTQFRSPRELADHVLLLAEAYGWSPARSEYFKIFGRLGLCVR